MVYNKDKWGEYCKLCAEIKELLRKRKSEFWNEVIDKEDYEEDKKKFWVFVGEGLRIRERFRFIILEYL